MIKIVVLDTNTVTNGDVSLEKITKLGDVSFFDMMPYDKLADIIGDADAVICNKANIDRNLMDKCPNLKYIGLFATGYNNIDTIAAKEKGIAVCNVPGYSTDSVAQTVFAFILHFATSVDMYNNSVQNGDWVISKTFSYFSFPLTEIAGKTLGIYGFGTIGKKVATIAKAFDMNVIAVSHKPQQYDGVTFVSKEELFKQSDYLSIHCPLTPETKCIVNEQTLKMMKKSAVLINTARGGCVDEDALCDALNNDIIAGAGIDVLTIEPMKDKHPYLSTKNTFITPHVAWASLEARTRLIDVVCSNISAFLSGKPTNMV